MIWDWEFILFFLVGKKKGRVEKESIQNKKKWKRICLGKKMLQVVLCECVCVKDLLRDLFFWIIKDERKKKIIDRRKKIKKVLRFDCNQLIDDDWVVMMVYDYA